jgi:hypothetical protein
MNESPRFVFTGEPLESVQDGADGHVDHYPDAASAVFRVFKGAGRTHLHFSHQAAEESYPTSLAWPGSGNPRVELADAVAQAVKAARPDPVLDPLRDRIARWKDDG